MSRIGRGVKLAIAAGVVAGTSVVALGAAVGTAAADGGPVVTSVVEPTSPVISTSGAPEAAATGGKAIEIEGSGFTGATAVTFSPAAGSDSTVSQATFTVVSDTEITTTVPAIGYSGLWDVVVTGSDGMTTSPTSSADEVAIMPVVTSTEDTVTSTSPAQESTSGGSTVALSGVGFVGTDGNPAVTGISLVNKTATLAVPSGSIGAVDATSVTISPFPAEPAGQYQTRVSTTLGNGFVATAGHVIVGTPGPPPPTPTISSFLPKEAPAGATTTITVKGKNFALTGSEVDFTGLDTTVPATCTAATECTFSWTPPADATQGYSVVFVNPSTKTSAAKTLYADATPDLASLSTTSAPKGTVVTADGSGFGPDAHVVFSYDLYGFIATVDVRTTYVNSGELTFKVPSIPAGLPVASVYVADAGGTSSSLYFVPAS